MELAHRIADFLYERNKDLRFLAAINPDEKAYLEISLAANKDAIEHGRWPPAENAPKPPDLTWQNKSFTI